MFRDRKLFEISIGLVKPRFELYASDTMSYAKSTHLENTSLWYIPCQQIKPTVKIKESELSLFYFIFHFYFLFDLLFYFSIFRTTRVRVDQSCCYKTNHKTWENLVEDSRTDDVIQHGYHMLAS